MDYMKLHLKNEPAPEQIKEMQAMAKRDNKAFKAWVVPALNKQIMEATRRGWKLQVGLAHYWLEGNAGLRVMISGDVYNGKRWLHLSASRLNRLPGWSELTKIKNLFLGEDVTALQVFPPQKQWVNLHPYVLHLWTPVDEPELLPDFRRELPDGRLGI